MAQFHAPRIQPYNAYKNVGTKNLKSKYIPNEYFVEFTPSWWRNAIDNAINYSDLTWLDTLYSWCMQSSPFLVSQLNKRLIPISKTKFAFANPDGTINESVTERLTRTNWFKKLVRARVLSRFYGVKVVGIDVVSDRLTDYPMRNIDIENRAIRYQTYDIENVAYVKDYDNLFYMQPDTDQDFKLGMMQPISRAMIGIVEAYNNWSVTSATYSYPRTAIYYMDGTKQYRQIAEQIARNLDPLDVPILPQRQNLDDKMAVPQIEIKPLQTQMYPDAFRVFKEYIDSYRSEIMQLVTGGTLLGATEKNTNSEQLANIHLALYDDICDDDKRDVLSFFNYEGTIEKLSRLLGDPSISELHLVEIPETSISLDKFERVMKGLGQVGLQPSASLFEKIGLEADDINWAVRNNNWSEVEVQKKTGMARVKEILSNITGNGNRKTAPGQSEETKE